MPISIRWPFLPAILFAGTALADNNPDQLNVLQSADGLEDTPGIEAPEYDAWRVLLYVLSHGYEGRLGIEAIAESDGVEATAREGGEQLSFTNVHHR